MQQFLTAWVNWYYGDSKYPADLYNNFTFEQTIEAMSRTAQIKKIMGKPRKTESITKTK